MFLSYSSGHLSILSVKVPISGQARCRKAYEHHTEITDKEICTWDRRGEKHCELGDSGGPLTIAGKLAGVLAFIGDNKYIPDVFINVAHPAYREWILPHLTNNLHNIHNLQNPHNFQNPHNLYVHNPYNPRKLHL